MTDHEWINEQQYMFLNLENYITGVWNHTGIEPNKPKKTEEKLKQIKLWENGMSLPLLVPPLS